MPKSCPGRRRVVQYFLFIGGCQGDRWHLSPLDISLPSCSLRAIQRAYEGDDNSFVSERETQQNMSELIESIAVEQDLFYWLGALLSEQP